MPESADPTLLVLCEKPPAREVYVALSSACEALGHAAGYVMCAVDGMDAEEIAALIEQADPWNVVAIDEASAALLAQSFGKASASLAPDAPICVDGYTFVAVPGFAECLHDEQAKRVAWGRLKAARHPGNPLG